MSGERAPAKAGSFPKRRLFEVVGRYNRGETVAELAAELGLDPRVVRRHLVQTGVRMRPLDRLIPGARGNGS